MKKTILILLAILVLAAPVFAGQKNYRQSSDEVQTLQVLARLSGTALPQMTYPVTEDNLIYLLSKIDTSALRGPAMQMYLDLKDSLENRKLLVRVDGVGFDFRLPVLIGEAWNSDSFLPFKDRLPLAAPAFEVDITDHLTLFSVFDLKADKGVYTGFEDIKIHSLYNIKDDLSHEFPSNAYGSAGYGAFNLTVGRDRMSAGDGMTGNLAISENLLFQDYAKLSVLKGPVSYDFSILAYDGFKNPITGNPFPVAEDVRHYNYNDKFKAAYLHRISAVILNKATVTLFQGLMTYGEHAFSDPRVLNPIMMIHNTFTFMNGNANNFVGAEVSASLPLGLRLDAQVFIDQMVLGSESSDSGKNSYGVLANLSGSWVVGNGILTGYAEGVYNNQALYLIEGDTSGGIDENPSAKESFYAIDLISAYRFFHDYQSEQNYIGYPYGGDVKVAAAGASYLWKGIKFSADAMYRIKGCYGIGTNEERRTDSEVSGPEEKTLSVAAGVSGKLFEALSYRVKLGYTSITDYQHIGGNDVNEFQFAVAFTVDPMSFIKK